MPPPGGSRHQEKDCREEGLVDGWMGWGLECGSSPVLPLFSPSPFHSLGGLSFQGGLGVSFEDPSPSKPGSPRCGSGAGTIRELSEMQVLRLRARLAESENLKTRPCHLCFNKPSGG